MPVAAAYTCTVYSISTVTGKINVYDKIVIENLKILKLKKFVHKSLSERWFRDRIHSFR